MSLNPSNVGDGSQPALPMPIPRPPFQLRSLPINYRWEVTRRHPYYQIMWKEAVRHHRNDETRDEVRRVLGQAAVHWLGAIGVSSEPPDPRTAFKDLGGEQLKHAWLSGAVHPVSFRGLVALLLVGLPKDTLASLSDLILVASHDDLPGDMPALEAMLQRLTMLDDAALNNYPDLPVVSINPAASGRDIEAALNAELADWKAKSRLDDQRTRPDKFDEYLDVWDRREGFHDGEYDRSQELFLRDVALRVDRPAPTVSNQYRSAFKLITGHPYSPELWLRFFGPLKLNCLNRLAPGIVSRRRPTKSPSPRPVPESTLGGTETPGWVSAAASVSSDQELVDLKLDIQSLFEQGWSDARIMAELELPPEAGDEIKRIRGRVSDLLF